MTRTTPPELNALKVTGETDVGWDVNTLPNETADEEGNPTPLDRGFGVPDPRAPKTRSYDDPDVVRLRKHLKANNGLKGLDVCSPDEIDRAVRIYRRDGFVVVRDLLDAEKLAEFRDASARVLREILSVPGIDGRKYTTETGRLPHRYSYGTSSASRQLLHDPVWAGMVDLPTTTPLLKALFATSDYFVVGAGGDLCLPGAIEYQHLHYDQKDSGEITQGRLAHARQLGIELRTRPGTSELLATTHRLILERTPPLITINFLMSDLTWENGPIRQIPGSHAMQQSPPKPEDEPEWMRLSTLVGGKAGWGVFRDNRAWHGATPNLSREIRAMPNVEYGPPWRQGIARTMPHEIWQTLSPHAQHICRAAKADAGVWPAGAGVMHPLRRSREMAAGGEASEQDY
ncbi:MAG: phytanoyl-CoA dioxygenase family protein [Proteobacteria bacterium]|nr:phytanoyl-CoA dioxygenase family protein [Pseudomonadota bacterium]